jgi:hypothetical protein
MDRSLLGELFERAPMASVAATAYGLAHSPRFTVNALNGLLYAAATELHTHLEDQAFAQQLVAMMSKCGPWRFGPETAEHSRAALGRLPATTQGVTLLDPYYFDHAMVYSDDSFREGASQHFTYAYRLHPCGVFALNFDPRRGDDTTLVESAICVAYLRGKDLWGRPLLFNAMWQEGLPLGSTCTFEIPRWGILRRAVEVGGRIPVVDLLKVQCEMAVETGGATRPEIEAVIRRFGGVESLPTPVERGFPILVGSVWFGDEPFPALTDFDYQLIGADLKQRKVSVPLWFRPSRADFT